MSLVYVANAFSLSMLDRESQAAEGSHRAIPEPILMSEARAIAYKASRQEALVSAIGHADIARIISAQLGIELPVNRTSVKLVRMPNRRRVDQLLVAQYVGPRLPEGATQLPEGAVIEWWLV